MSVSHSLFLLSFLLLLSTGRCVYDLAAWDVSAVDATSDTTVPNSFVSTFLEASSLTKGSGVTAAAGAGWLFSNWATSISSKGADQYIEFSITPNDVTQSLLIDRGVIQLYIGTNGPTDWALDVSRESDFSSRAGGATFGTSVGNRNYSIAFNIRTPSGPRNPARAISSGTPLYFRLYGYGAASTNGIGGLREEGLTIGGWKRTVFCSSCNASCDDTSRTVIVDECTAFYFPCSSSSSVQAIVTKDTGSEGQFTITTYAEANNCTTPTGTATSPCGTCNSLGLYVSCSAQCGSSSSCSDMYSFSLFSSLRNLRRKDE